MKVGDLVRRKWRNTASPDKDFLVGLVVGRDRDMMVVQWFDSGWAGNAYYHPENLEVVGEGG